MDSTDTIRLIRVNNPFRRDQRTEHDLVYEHRSLQSLHDELVAGDEDLALSINGIVVEPEFWPTTIPRPGDRVIVIPRFTGDDDKQILSAVAMIAVSMAAPGLAVGLGFTAGSTAAAVAAGAIQDNADAGSVYIFE